MRFQAVVKAKFNMLNVIFFKELSKRLLELSEFKLQPLCLQSKKGN